jgi:hypothetical protein
VFNEDLHSELTERNTEQCIISKEIYCTYLLTTYLSTAS